MKSRLNSFLFYILFFLFGYACTTNNVYYSYKPVSVNGWERNAPVVFSPDGTDSLSTYNLFIEVRNRNNYPYTSLWLFIAQSDSTGSINKVDTLECVLADKEKKEFIGKGSVSILQNSFLYKQNISFKNNIPHITIIQGMREESLKGITDIGLRIEKRD